MKRTDLIFSAILVPIDYCMLVLAGVLAYQLRFGGTVSGIRPVLFDFPLYSYFPALLFTATGFIIIFALSGLYIVRTTRRFLEECTTIFIACSASIMAIIVLFFFQREFFSSRFIIVTGWILAFVCVAFGRAVVRIVQRQMLARKIGAYRVVIVGGDTTTSRLAEELSRNHLYGYDIVREYPVASEQALSDIAALHVVAPIDIILQADTTLGKTQTARLLDFADEHHITFQYAADIFDARATNLAVETFSGIPVIEVRRTKLLGWGRIVKRTVDIILSLVAIIASSPAFLVTALFIKADSDGPVFVKLDRVGQAGRRFFLYKFRSMVKNAHAMKPSLMRYNERSDGPLFKMKNDPRITRIGRFIRKVSIDELPQLFNVLRGEMSLVGPRPHEPEEVALYEKHHRQLMTIKPGVTGLAQISGRSDLHFHEEARLDIFYIENWSLRMDFSILTRTPAVVLRMRTSA